MTRNTTRTPAVTDSDLTGTKLARTEDMDLGDHDRSITLDSDLSLEDLRDSLNSTVTMNPEDPAFKKFTEDSKFMDEKVLVRILPSSDKHAEKIICIGNGGTNQHFLRGEWTIAKRKYVEVLARAKPFSVQTPEITDGNGDRTTKIDLSHGLRYPFEMRDQNPIGQTWLNHIMQQP